MFRNTNEEGLVLLMCNSATVKFYLRCPEQYAEKIQSRVDWGRWLLEEAAVCCWNDETPTDVLLKTWAAFSTWSSLEVSVSTFHFITVCGGLKSIAGLVELVSHSTIPICSSMHMEFHMQCFLLLACLWLVGTSDYAQGVVVLFLILS